MPRPLPFIPRWPSLERQAVLLLFAFLPTLTFAGHWDMPALRDFVNSSLPGGHDHRLHSHSPSGEHDHAHHCHAEMASCSDVPFTGGSTVAFLRESLVDIAAAAPLFRTAAADAPRSSALATVSPSLQPPNPPANG